MPNTVLRLSWFCCDQGIGLSLNILQQFSMDQSLQYQVTGFFELLFLFSSEHWGALPWKPAFDEPGNGLRMSYVLDTHLR